VKIKTADVVRSTSNHICCPYPSCGIVWLLPNVSSPFPPFNPLKRVFFLLVLVLFRSMFEGSALKVLNRPFANQQSLVFAYALIRLQ
jgi:hypothetical protein